MKNLLCILSAPYFRKLGTVGLLKKSHGITNFGNQYVYGNYIDEVLLMNGGSDDYCDNNSLYILVIFFKNP